jgi:GNAT superfamily N-acetyltransferase
VTGVEVREVRRGDLDGLAELCREHAEFDHTPDEVITPLPDDLPARLEAMLFGPEPAMWCHVAADGASLAGYASYAWQPSTWRGDAYVLMDCLYVRDGYRGQAVGRRLFDAGVEHARRLGATRLQWQTPAWNDGSQRFYDRTGAHGWRKVRYTLPL